jgi:hypothetical protein
MLGTDGMSSSLCLLSIWNIEHRPCYSKSCVVLGSMQSVACFVMGD